jgi:hypothetical protein
MVFEFGHRILTKCPTVRGPVGGFICRLHIIGRFVDRVHIIGRFMDGAHIVDHGIAF